MSTTTEDGRRAKTNDGTITVTATSKRYGVAGQIIATATVRYDWDANEYTDAYSEEGVWELHGSAFGGPLVAVGPSGLQAFVMEQERFGDFPSDPREYMRRYVLDIR